MTNAETSKYRVVQWWRNLSELLKAVVFAGVVLIFATIIFSGFYVVAPAGGGVYVVNKYTGGVTYCAGMNCVDSGPPKR